MNDYLLLNEPLLPDTDAPAELDANFKKEEIVQIQLRRKQTTVAEDCIFMAQNCITSTEQYKSWLQATLNTARQQYDYLNKDEYEYVICTEGANMFLGVVK